VDDDVASIILWFPPPKTNLMAPLSTRSLGIMSGYLCSSFRVGKYGPSQGAYTRPLFGSSQALPVE